MADESRATPAELTQKQKKFADYLIKLGRDRATEAAKLAGYSEKSARQSGYANMQKASVKAYIEERLKTAAEPRERAEAERKLVADGDEVLQFLTATMRGEVKDQFGLDAQLKDRLAAAKELQRIIDVTKKTDDGGSEGGTTLIIEPIYGAPEAEDDE
ncbi:terminase small subunit [Phascolarctobacterium sp.]